MKPYVKTAAKWGLYGLVGLAAVLAIASASLQFDAVRERLHTFAVTKIEGALDVEVRAGRLEGSLIWNVGLADVDVREEGELLARVHRLEASYDISRLLVGELKIDSATLFRPLIVLRPSEGGPGADTEQGTNGREPSGSETNRGTSGALQLDSLQIRGGRFVYVDPTSRTANGETPFDRFPAVASFLEEPTDAGWTAAGEAVERGTDALPGPPPVVLAENVELEAGVRYGGPDDLDADVDRLDFDVVVPGASRHGAVESAQFTLDPSRARATLDSLSLEGWLAIPSVRAAAERRAGPSPPETPYPLGIHRYAATLEGASVSATTDRFLPQTVELEPDVRATVRSAGTPDRADALVKIDAGDGSTRAAAAVEFGADRPHWRVHLSGRRLRPGQFIDSPLPATVRPTDANLAVRVAGEGVAPPTASVETEVVLWESDVGNMRLERLHAGASLEAGAIELSHFSAVTRQLKVRAQGRGDPRGEFELDVETRARTSTESDIDLPDSAALDLQADMTWGDTPTPGPQTLRTADIELAWTVDDPYLPAGELSRTEGELSARYRPIDGRQTLEMRGSGHLESLDLFGLSAAAGRLTVDIAGPFDAADLPDPSALLGLTGDAELNFEQFRRGDRTAARELKLGLGVQMREATDGPDLTVSAEGRDITAGAASVGRMALDATVAPVRRGNAPDRQLVLEAADGTLSLRDLEVPGFSAARLGAELRASGPFAAPEGRLALEAPSGEIASRTYTDMGLTLEYGPDRLSLDARARPGSEGAGPLVVRARTTRPGKERTTVESLTVGPSDDPWTTRSPFELTYGPDRLTIDSMQLASGEHELAVDGTLSRTGEQSLSVDLRNLDIGAAAGPFVAEGESPIEGRVDLSLSIAGTADTPILDLDLEGRGLKTGALDPTRLTVGAAYRDGLVEVGSLRLSGPERTLLDLQGAVPARLSLSGGFAPRWTASGLNAELEIPAAPLSDWFGPLISGDTIELGGSLGADLQVAGTLDSPTVRGELLLDEGAADGDLMGTSVDFDEVRYRASIRYGVESAEPEAIAVTSRLEWDGRDLADFSMQLPVPASGRLSDLADAPLGALAGQPLRAEGSIDEFNLSDLPIESLEEGSAEGAVRGNLRLQGTATDPLANFGFHVGDAGLGRIRDVYLDISGRTRRRQLLIDRLHLEWDADTILVGRGQIPLPYGPRWSDRSAEEIPFDLSVQYGPLPLRKLSAFDYTFSRFSGTTSAYLRLGGTLASPKLDARAMVDGSHFWRDVDSTYAVSVGARDGRATLRAAVCDRDETRLSARLAFPLELRPDRLAGGRPLIPDGSIEGAVRGDDVDLRHLVPQPLVATALEDLEGVMDADLTIDGTTSAPVPSGEIGLYDVSFVLVSLRRRLQNIDLRAELTPRSIELNDFHLEDRSGALDASGEVQLGSLVKPDADPSGEAGAFQMKARLRRLDTTGLTPMTSAVVSSRVDISGDAGENPIPIDIEARELDIRLPKLERSENYPLALHTDIRKRRAPENRTEASREKAAAEASSHGAPTGLTIDVTTDRSSQVHHPYGQARFETDLTVDVRDNETSISGRVGTLEGEVDILGRTFEVSERTGAVQFTKSNPPNPRLDLEALHLLDRDLAAQLGSISGGQPKVVGTVRGRAAEPELKLTSKPQLSESEIMYVLSTGRAPTSTTAGEDESAVNQALATASGAFSGMLQQKLAGNIPLDTIRLDPEGGAAKLKVGTYITSDLFLAYAHTFGAQEDDSLYEAEIKYHFLPGWVAEAVYGQGNTGDLNVFWDVY